MQNIEKKRHSCAHIVAAAVQELYPDAKFGVGPTIDNGFYYDIKFVENINEDDLQKIEKKAKHLIKQNVSFEKEEVNIEQAIKMFTEIGQDYKVSLLKDLKEKGTTKMSEEELQDLGDSVEQVTLYRSGGFVDLCRGPHIESSKELNEKGLKLQKLAGAYWRGDESNPMLTRIYGVYFDNKDELDEYLVLLEEAKKRDHRKLGKEMDLFVFSNLVGQGMPLYTPNGALVRREIANYSNELQKTIGYEEVHTPQMNKAELFKVSGHYDKFKDDMISCSSHYSDEEYFLKPMNCPQHTQIFASRTRSYRDLPIRYSDFANLFRDEKPGELAGLARLRCFAQDDGHSFCREDQIEEEFKNVLDIIHTALQTYGLDYYIQLSLWDEDNKEKYLGDEVVWEKSQKMLENLLVANNIEYKIKSGEAAFYGPKMDVIATDALKREWQISTIQLDFNMPVRFALVYTDKDGSEKNPVMIHRAIVGSPDRFMGILIEHYGGAFPLWLSPVQVLLVPVSEKHLDGANTIAKELSDNYNIRVEIDGADETVGNKIRKAVGRKIPYVVVVGDTELSGENWTIRVRGQEEQIQMSKEEFTAKIVEDTKNRKLGL